MDPVDGDQVYAAERLLQIRTRRGKQEYLVKWKGWSTKYNTWEPVENILDDRLIKEFEQNQGSRTPATKRRSGAPPNAAATSSLSSSSAGAPPAKRGKPNVDAVSRVKIESSSESAAASNLITPRRSSRHSSAAKESRESSVITSKQHEPKAKSMEGKNAIDSAIKTKHIVEKEQEGKQVSLEEAKETIPDQSKQKKSIETKEPEVTETEQEISSNPQTEEEQPQNQDELKKTDITPAIDAKNNQTTETKEEIAAPLEIFVEKKLSEASNNHIENGREKAVNDIHISETTTTNTNESQNNDAYIITNETDPNCTHKIQVFNKQDKVGDEAAVKVIDDQRQLIVAKTAATTNDNGNNIHSVADNVTQEPTPMVKDDQNTDVGSAVTETVSGGISTNYSVEEGDKKEGVENKMSASSTASLLLENDTTTASEATTGSE